MKELSLSILIRVLAIASILGTLTISPVNAETAIIEAKENKKIIYLNGRGRRSDSNGTENNAGRIIRII